MLKSGCGGKAPERVEAEEWRPKESRWRIGARKGGENAPERVKVEERRPKGWRWTKGSRKKELLSGGGPLPSLNHLSVNSFSRFSMLKVFQDQLLHLTFSLGSTLFLVIGSAKMRCAKTCDVTPAT